MDEDILEDATEELYSELETCMDIEDYRSEVDNWARYSD